MKKQYWIALGVVVVLVLVVLFTYKGSGEVFQGKVGVDERSYKPKGVASTVEIMGMCVIFCENGNTGGSTSSCSKLTQKEADESCAD